MKNAHADMSSIIWGAMNPLCGLIKPVSAARKLRIRGSRDPSIALMRFLASCAVIWPGVMLVARQKRSPNSLVAWL